MSRAPLNQDAYPVYFLAKGMLLAFVGPKEMFKVEPRGSNMNPGVTIDHYVTRNMVIKYWEPGGKKEIPAYKFRELVTKLYDAYLDKML